MKAIDMTPTWGELGNLYCRLAETQEVKAIRGMRSEMAKAFAAAEALNSISDTLTDEQRKLVSETLSAELQKQGY